VKQDESPSPSDHYDADYFLVQEAKSDAKVAWEYERLLALGGVRLAPGARILDAACGAAPGLRFFHAAGYTVVGSDIAPAALRAARRFLPDVPLIQADLDLPQPFAADSFDLIVLREAIEHVRDGAATLRECMRILRPRGCVALTTPNRWDARRPLYRLRGAVWSGDADPTHTHIYSPPEMRDLLQRVGFASVRVRTGYKPAARFGGRRLPFHVAVPYPPRVGNTIAAFGWRDENGGQQAERRQAETLSTQHSPLNTSQGDR
jgi:SAM-dependent methyltransferase